MPYFQKILDGSIFWLINVPTSPCTSLCNIRILFVFVIIHLKYVENISTHVCTPISHPEQPCADTGVCCHPHVSRMRLQSMTGSTWL